MEPDFKGITEAILRWGHVIAGITWIGHLYFFNWVNGPFAATLDKETKPKVVPELMPRALFWFRWGAAWTWITGVLLGGLVFWMNKTTMFTAWGESNVAPGWTAASGALVALVLIAPFLYDAICKSGLGKSNQTLAIVGVVLMGGLLYAYQQLGSFSYRASLIHMGATFGTIMAYNVWFRIWPLQKKIIAAVKSGQAPDQSWPAVAGARSKHNTYMSVPLVYGMLNAHMSTLAIGPWPLTPVLAIVVGWLFVQWCYKKAATVKGF